MTRGVQIKIKLVEFRLSNAWLIYELSKRGIFINSSDFSCALSGTRSGPNINRVIAVSEEILNDYETKFLQA